MKSKALLVITLVFFLWPATAFADTQFKNLLNTIDLLWVVVATGLVFLMQAGFLLFETGMVQRKNVTATAIKNCIDWTVVSLLFFLLGFGFAFGPSIHGLFGFGFFAGEGLDQWQSYQHLGLGLVFFFCAFAATSITIVSGAMLERTGFITYLSTSVLIGVFIFPIICHWVWGDLVLSDNVGWLGQLGFHDFAGATVVHGVGAWIALVGVWMLGPRIGRYGQNGQVNEFKPHGLGLTALGVIILWFGWWGFNGGSLLKVDGRLGEILIHTNLAGASAGLAAFFYGFFIQKRRDLYGRYLGGIIGGLVAITACADVVTPLDAIAIGFIAGILHNISHQLIIYKWRLDDTVGVIPAHGICGAWGTLAVALFGQAELLNLPRFEQLLVQALGIGAVFLWCVFAAWILFSVLRATVGLRVSPDLERDGLSIIKEFTPTQIEKADESLLKAYEEKSKGLQND